MKNVILRRIIWGLLIGIIACGTPLKIKDIQQHPRKYVDKTVMVKGKVINTFSLVFVKYFEIDDGTGKIPVITKKTLPKKGEIIKIKGKVKYFTIGGLEKLVIEEENGKH